MCHDPWSSYVKFKPINSLIMGKIEKKHVRVTKRVTFNWEFALTAYNFSFPRLLCSEWIEGNRVI